LGFVVAINLYGQRDPGGDVFFSADRWPRRLERIRADRGEECVATKSPGQPGREWDDRLPIQFAGVLSIQQANQPITIGRILERICSFSRLLRRQTQTRLPSLRSSDVLMLFFNTCFGSRVLSVEDSIK